MMAKRTRRSDKVLFVQEWLPSYRVEFFDSLEAELQSRNIQLIVAHGDAPEAMKRRQIGSPAAARCRDNRYVRFGPRHLVWQPWTDEVRDADLLIVNEGGRFLLNYWLLARHRRRLAFWGHGANLDETSALRAPEAVKRQMYRLPHWWFAYTEGSRERIRKVGFPNSRITVVQNAPSTESLRTTVAEIESGEAASLRAELDLGDGPVGLFLGSLYPAKRLDLLIQAVDYIASERRNFSLVIAGDGPEREKVVAATAGHANIRMAGPVDGRKKATLLSMADMLLLPGAVGLSVTDGFAAGIPTVTCEKGGHGPEYEYLEHGVNGHVVPADATAHTYAQAVGRLLGDSRYLERLGRQASKSAALYTAAEMVRRFSDGIETALGRYR